MKTIFFDIETGALPEAELAAMVPAFEPAEVKTGNLKDPDKIAAKLAEAEANHRRDFFERAALDPLTGRVVAIGLLEWGFRSADCGLKRATSPLPLSADGEGKNWEFSIIGDEDEAQTLREFWAACRGEMGRVHQMVGFNIYQFDLPFLVRRSWKHRVEVPFGIRRGRYWADEMVDLREYWQLGDRQARGSLDSISKHLGVGGKNGDGKAFAELWRTNREQAVAYLRNDVELTALVAGALAVVKR